MRTEEEVEADIRANDKQQMSLGVARGLLEKELHDILLEELLRSGILGKVTWKPARGGFAKITLERVGKNYEPEEIFKLFAWEHGEFELDDNSVLHAADGELFLRFDEPEDFKKWNDRCHFQISSASVDKEIRELEVKLGELRKMKEQIV